ncbi:uncharacterized protein LOC110184391 isoform X1 [Drosophila serrata]|uniref:uncharacterized protein LOC110184391 isoform X1 n=1 Tax=Drosophila serrata TaxID=7274 RepID=UPI000A1D0F9D|nr:uncharacterized protein LOC110184391 isoform X1 [Drosophila serrata]
MWFQTKCKICNKCVSWTDKAADSIHSNLRQKTRALRLPLICVRKLFSSPDGGAGVKGLPRVFPFHKEEVVCWTGLSLSCGRKSRLFRQYIIKISHGMNANYCRNVIELWHRQRGIGVILLPARWWNFGGHMHWNLFHMLAITGLPFASALTRLQVSACDGAIYTKMF